MTPVPRCRTLRLVLGDQLDIRHSWFAERDGNTLYVLAELPQEACYVRHHVQKVLAFFLAMRRFSEQLEEAGHRVLWLDLDDTAEFDSLTALLDHLLTGSGAQLFQYQRPDEYRVHQQLQD